MAIFPRYDIFLRHPVEGKRCFDLNIEQVHFKLDVHKTCPQQAYFRQAVYFNAYPSLLQSKLYIQHSNMWIFLSEII